MTPDEQNKRIAEWCGFKDGHYKCEGCGSTVKWDDDSVTSGGHHGGNGCGAKLLSPPNYCQDLNAIHEAEERLLRSEHTDMLGMNYWNEIWKVSNDPFGKLKTIAHATAAQRAEALLRTIGRWQD